MQYGKTQFYTVAYDSILDRSTRHANKMYHTVELDKYNDDTRNPKPWAILRIHTLHLTWEKYVFFLFAH